MVEEKSFKEKRIRNITSLYYSNKEIQNAIFEFAKHREISPRYFTGFGKRPDAFQYKGDIFELVKKGATSFHCSEELWEQPLEIQTGMTEEESNDLRIGWDLLIDIDCKWFDYAKLAAKAIIRVLEKNNLQSIGLKFSGSKGFHIIVPWKAFPKQIGGENTKNLFPDLPRKIMAYIRFEAEKELQEILPEDFYSQFQKGEIKKGIKCNNCSEIATSYELIEFFCKRCNVGEQRKLPEDNTIEFKCPSCGNKFDILSSEPYFECTRCNINSKQNSNNFSKTISADFFELMGLDLVLVSPRHLFRMPYSLHEKTALASVVLDLEELDSFELKHADPLKIKIKNFLPDAKEDEAKELVIRALDWYSNYKPAEVSTSTTGKFANFKAIELKNLEDSQFPPCILNALKGIVDGKKRALFALINFFRSIGMEKEQMEKRIYEWNDKNNPPLKKGYIVSQLQWAYRKKPIMPPNCKEFYQGIACCQPDHLCSRVKNPVNYAVKKNFARNANDNKSNGKKKIGRKK